MPRDHSRKRAKNIAAVVGALVLIAIIIWIDITTGLWSELVIIAGLAAGLVTFLLTVMVLDKIVARSTERKWAPVTRLALTEFLHMIADEKHSEISRGHIVPRLFPVVDRSPDAVPLHDQLHKLRHHVVAERRHLSEALGRWAEFLASSGDNDQALRHIATISLQLDRIRDAALEAEHSPGETTHSALSAEIQRGNESILALESELRALIEKEDRLIRPSS